MNAPSKSTKPELDSSKVWAFRLLALLIPTLIGVLVIGFLMVRLRFIVKDDEGNVSVQRPFYLQEPDYETTGHQYLFDAKLGWRNIPDYSAATHDRELNINSKGLRDRDYPYEKPAGTTRILALGDSFTWGYGVADSEIYTEVLERMYARQPTSETPAAARESIEILNAGVSGWGNDQQYLFLIDDGLKYDPDIVVVGFFLLNDPIENTLSRVYEMNKPVFLDEDLTIGNTPVTRPRYYPMEETEVEPVPLTLAIFKGMAKQCAEHDAKLVIMKFGRFLNQSEEVVDREREFADELATWDDVHYLDLDAAFDQREHSQEALTEGNHDGHWNAFGHQVTAEILGQFLHEQGLIEGPPPTK